MVTSLTGGGGGGIEAAERETEGLREGGMEGGGWHRKSNILSERCGAKDGYMDGRKKNLQVSFPYIH